MADTVSVTVIEDGPRNYIVHLIGLSDGTGETDVVKVDLSTLGGPNPANSTPPASLAIKDIQYDVQGYSSVTLAFGATADQPLARMALAGMTEFEPLLNSIPTATGYTGDILLTSNGATTGATYDIVLRMVKQTTPNV